VAIRLDCYRRDDVQNCDLREIARLYLVEVAFYSQPLARPSKVSSQSKIFPSCVVRR
jgi:hypothetical protein